MTTTDATPALHVPARDIPVPAHLSHEARSVLAMAPMQPRELPALDDRDGWRTTIAARDEAVLSMIAEQASRVAADTAEIDLDGVIVYVITPQGTPDDDRRVFLEIHGGGFITGGGACCRAMGINAVARAGVRMWAVDFRMPPDHPYPIPLDDCVAAYRALLQDHRPDEIIVGGTSSGGNLAAAMILRARDEGLALPAAAVLLTPEADLTESGDTFQTNAGVDTMLRGGTPQRLLYAGDHDLANPSVSPLFGDFTKGFPPTLLASGTRDLYLSNTVRMHRALRAAGVPAELHVVEAAPHGGFLGLAPEDHELLREVRRFIDAHWGAT
jgi:epsilon-lactone hydrolase